MATANETSPFNWEPLRSMLWLTLDFVPRTTSSTSRLILKARALLAACGLSSNCLRRLSKKKRAAVLDRAGRRPLEAPMMRI
jgi:hypothetical protein